MSTLSQISNVIWSRQDIRNMYFNVHKEMPTEDQVDKVIDSVDWEAIEDHCISYASEDIHNAIVNLQV